MTQAELLARTLLADRVATTCVVAAATVRAILNRSDFAGMPATGQPVPIESWSEYEAAIAAGKARQEASADEKRCQCDLERCDCVHVFHTVAADEQLGYDLAGGK